MTSASAITEQRIKGHIGQPAACMIENKALSGGVGGSDGGVRARVAGDTGWQYRRAIMADGSGDGTCSRAGVQRAERALEAAEAASAQLSTEAVDNVVGNRWLRLINPRRPWCLHPLHKKSARLLTMQIKHLRLHDRFVTRRAPRWPLRGAAVEFHPRVVAGVSRD